jgi:two-component system nitrogen regulation response regulator GlnG
MQEVFRAIGSLAHSNITVLINGESGTGKELVARALHRHSPRAGAPFIALNMAAIPRDLMESELFGHEKGAFTGANSRREGRFEQANGGTLFLDEIGDMPAETQTRLLRVLADGEFYRVGGHVALRTDVRIIAATHQDLEELVRRGRLSRGPVPSPQRDSYPHPAPRGAPGGYSAADAILLRAGGAGTRWRDQGAAAGDGAVPDVPGLARQRAAAGKHLPLADGHGLRARDTSRRPAPELGRRSTEVSADDEADWQTLLAQWARNQLVSGKQHILREAMPAIERSMIEVALAHTRGRKRDAAELLGWGRNTLTRKMKELGMSE